jgi:uncharacterized protein
MSGKIVHFELPAQDTTKAKAFYGGVFGWEFGDSAIPGFEYFIMRTGDDQGGAIMSSEQPAAAPIVYFDTDDIEASIARVREHGGHADDKQPIPQIGWFTHCTDPEGLAFSLFESDESVGA